MAARRISIRIALVTGLVMAIACGIFNVDEQPSFYIETPEDGEEITLDEETLSKEITITAHIPEGQGVASVLCYVDTVLLGEKSSPPYTWIWVATTEDEGEHTIRVVARDASGNERETAIHVTIIVPPFFIQTPADGVEIALDVVSLQKNITIEAGGAGAANVLCYVDSVLLGEKDSPPYSWTWVATIEDIGSHTITVIARDDSGNEREIAIHITIIVPLFFIQTPEDGAEIALESVSLQKNINVVANITSNAGIAHVSCYVDSVLLGEKDSPPYSWTWVATMEDTGSHTITAIARDASGNERETAIQINIIVPKSALQFDGVDGYVIFENSDSLNPVNAITISMWLYLSIGLDCDGNNNNWRGLLSKEWSWQNLTGYDVILEDERNLIWSVATAGGALRYGGSVPLPIVRWTFATFVYDASTSQAKIYFNGEEISGEYESVGTGNIQPNSSDLRLNTPSIDCPPFEGNFPGLIDEARIWNVARTQAEIQADMNREISGTEPGLVGYWRFNEGSDSTAFDQTSNHNDGTLHGGVTWVISTAPINP